MDSSFLVGEQVTSEPEVGIVLQTLGHGGGMERYGMDLVHGLNALGVQPTVYSYRVDPALPPMHIRAVHRLGSRLMPRKLKAYALSARLQHLATRQALPPLIGCCRIAQCTLAVCGGTHRGFLEHMGQRAGLFDRLEIGLEARFYDNSTKVLAHSRFMRDELRQHYQVPGAKIHTLYPPVSTSQFGIASDSERAVLRQRLGFSQRETLFLFVSTGHRRKGFALLQSFFSRTSLPVRLLVAGRPIPGKTDNITYLGYRTDLEQIYRAVDFTLHPSLYEPFGLSCVESIRCGTPVIVSDRVGASEVIARGAQIVLPALTVEALARAVDEALQRREPLREQARSAPLGYDPSPVTHARALLQLLATDP
ncbi:MAG TPA: glycosyltransferase family 4 protein [Acidiferrobacteraceae bacterium]|nr:glycosyltransferase family 4 protein [Acidiferrobacteraceae bacterium]